MLRLIMALPVSFDDGATVFVFKETLIRFAGCESRFFA